MEVVNYNLGFADGFNDRPRKFALGDTTQAPGTAVEYLLGYNAGDRSRTGNQFEEEKPMTDERPAYNLPPGETRTTSSTGGMKGVKAERYDLIPVEALDIMARLYGFGAIKYDAHNWRKGYDWSKSYASLMRHATRFWAGEDLDEETGLPHLAGVGFHAFTLMVFMQEHPDFDDRFKPAQSLVEQVMADMDGATEAEDETSAREDMSKAMDNLLDDFSAWDFFKRDYPQNLWSSLYEAFMAGRQSNANRPSA